VLADSVGNLGFVVARPANRETQFLEATADFARRHLSVGPRSARDRSRSAVAQSVSRVGAQLVRRYLSSMKTTMSSKGQIVLPAEFREQDHILPGQQFEVERLQDGEYLLRRARTTGGASLLEWLRSCPDGGWVKSVPSESTYDSNARAERCRSKTASSPRQLVSTA
jgi:AbrB family looped-hinge helix DNA binding protein